MRSFSRTRRARQLSSRSTSRAPRISSSPARVSCLRPRRRVRSSSKHATPTTDGRPRAPPSTCSTPQATESRCSATQTPRSTTASPTSSRDGREARPEMPTAGAVSVVIPAQNAAAWIAETISSVVAQSAREQIESICVVDDGSSDDTASIAAAALARTGIAHTVVRANGVGPSAARNLGWRHSRAPWLQFLDADDLLMPTKIERQLAAAIGLAEDVAVVYSPWSDLHSEGGVWTPAEWLRDPRIGADTLADQLENENFIATGSQLFRRAWLERVGGFDERLRLIEDVD